MTTILQPIGGLLTLATTNHPAGILVSQPTAGIYGINPGLTQSDAFTSLTVVVSSDHLDVNPVIAYVDGVANGTLTHGAGDVWTYVPGTPVVFTVGRHNITATFIDTVGGSTTLTLSFFTVDAGADKGIKKLSSTLGQLKKGYAYDSTFGKTPIAQVILAPAVEGTSDVHGAITLPTTGTLTVTTAITNPDVVRNLSVKGNAASVAALVTIVGADMSGRIISETIQSAGTSTVYGKFAFATVLSITVGARGAVSNTIIVGTGSNLGLSRPITEDTDVKLVMFADVTVASAGHSDGNTVSFTGTMNDTKNVVVFYEATVI